MPEPGKPIRRMEAEGWRVKMARWRNQQRRAAREEGTSMASDEKVPLTAAQKKSRWLKALGIFVFLAAYFAPPQYKPFVPMVNNVGRNVIEAIYPDEAATPTPVPSPTPVQVGQWPGGQRWYYIAVDNGVPSQTPVQVGQTLAPGWSRGPNGSWIHDGLWRYSAGWGPYAHSGDLVTVAER